MDLDFSNTTCKLKKFIQNTTKNTKNKIVNVLVGNLTVLQLSTYKKEYQSWKTSAIVIVVWSKRCLMPAIAVIIVCFQFPSQTFQHDHCIHLHWLIMSADASVECWWCVDPRVGRLVGQHLGGIRFFTFIPKIHIPENSLLQGKKNKIKLTIFLCKSAGFQKRNFSVIIKIFFISNEDNNNIWTCQSSCICQPVCQRVVCLTTANIKNKNKINPWWNQKLVWSWALPLHHILLLLINFIKIVEGQELMKFWIDIKPERYNVTQR